jgi:hypothetical protein
MCGAQWELLTMASRAAISNAADPAVTFGANRRIVKRGLLETCICIAAATLTVVGCGEPGGDIEQTVKARGLLTHRGNPLAHYQIMLHPADGHRPAAGVSDEHGKFALGTNGEGDGAVAGENRVSVVYVGPPSTNPEKGMNDVSPPPAPKVRIAAKYGQPDTSGLTLAIPATGSSDLKLDIP